VSRVVLEWYNGGSWNGWLDLCILAMASLDSMDLELMSTIPNNVPPSAYIRWCMSSTRLARLFLPVFDSLMSVLV
jgi:hypothetical protein